MKTVSAKFNSNVTNHKGLPIVAQKAAALLGLLVLAPLLLIVACLIKLESRGPLIFSQTRVGEQGSVLCIRPTLSNGKLRRK